MADMFTEIQDYGNYVFEHHSTSACYWMRRNLWTPDRSTDVGLPENRL